MYKEQADQKCTVASNRTVSEKSKDPVLSY